MFRIITDANLLESRLNIALLESDNEESQSEQQAKSRKRPAPKQESLITKHLQALTSSGL